MATPDSPSSKKPESDAERGRQIGKFSGVGMQMLVVIGLSAWGGVTLDKKMGWEPWGTIILTLLGVFIAMYQVIRAVSEK
ncbi:AtpZ/AtpI family protein [Hymenobacter latericus]|uniref:AtpZ/AtpI family protein n=1 Tax=Hymenobacter sp. YIM 151858-1 TaxID=2987688 RepID=UPI0022262E3F|nr:AtpZ/AtpI family protein [Hymenobacter sp. YIM 151858-1]UYZ58647.1 AtpZ/AtpI family protein [Hymenobacter sp. YIM 151858-1]